MPGHRLPPLHHIEHQTLHSHVTGSADAALFPHFFTHFNQGGKQRLALIQTRR
jgi:hypothetical protein